MKKILPLLLIVSSVILTGCEAVRSNNTSTDTSTDTNNSVYETGIYENNPRQDDANERGEEKDDTKSQEDNSTENDNDTALDAMNDLEMSSNIENSTASGEIIVDVIPASTTNLSNKTYAWGFRRMKDEVQPEFTASYTKVLDDYDGIYVGNSGERRIYLTFDEGYENGYTDDILDTLKEKEVTAVFFVTMPYVKQNPDLIRRMIDEGHIVGNHTVNHPSMPSVTDDEKLKKEIMGLHDYMVENYEYEMTYLRPPKGEYSERTAKIARDLGYATVLWSSAYDDWDVNNQKGHDYAKKMIINYAHNGCVMLLHAVSKDNTEVLGEIIDTLRGRGYEFYSLDDFER